MQEPTRYGHASRGVHARGLHVKGSPRRLVSKVHPYQYGVTFLESCPLACKGAARSLCAAISGTLIGIPTPEHVLCRRRGLHVRNHG